MLLEPSTDERRKAKESVRRFGIRPGIRLLVRHVAPKQPPRSIARVAMLLLIGKHSLLEQVVDDAPDNALGRYNLGVALLAAGDARSAAAELERARELVPELYGARLALADAYRRLGRLQRAEAVLRRLVEDASCSAMPASPLRS